MFNWWCLFLSLKKNDVYFYILIYSDKKEDKINKVDDVMDYILCWILILLKDVLVYGECMKLWSWWRWLFVDL